MNPAIENLVEKYFHVNKLEEVDESVVEQLAGKYPYYAPLQYLLARKYKQMDDLLYRLQVTKTAVFFSNPHWLNDLLQNDPDRNPDESPIPPADERPGEIENEPDIQEPALPLPVPDNEASLDGQALDADESEYKTEEAEETGMEPEAAIAEQPSDTDGPPEELPVKGAEDVPVSPEAPEDSEATAPEPEAAISGQTSDMDDSPEELQVEGVEDVPISPEAPEDSDATVPEPEAAIAEPPLDMDGPPEELQVEGVEDVPISPEAPEYSNATVPEPEAAISGQPSDTDDSPEKLQIEGVEEVLVPPEHPEDNEATVPEPGKEEGDQSSAVKAVSSFIVPGLEETPVLLSPPSENALPVIPVEPLFTVDYFASQGIRWNNEEGSDKLSKKLRSFTEWLKTMKRLHPEKMEEEMEKGRDGAIQNIAEHSNELDEVVTETMAEVFARQGLGAKAVEVYQKLSLLNPEKRAYFAARISKLNQT